MVPSTPSVPSNPALAGAQPAVAPSDPPPPSPVVPNGPASTPAAQANATVNANPTATATATDPSLVLLPAAAVVSVSQPKGASEPPASPASLASLLFAQAATASAGGQANAVATLMQGAVAAKTQATNSAPASANANAANGADALAALALADPQGASVNPAIAANAPQLVATHSSTAGQVLDASTQRNDTTSMTPGSSTQSPIAMSAAAAPADAATRAEAAPSMPRPTPPIPPVAEQIAVQVSKAAQGDNNRITIQLKPESLGRIDVQLDIRHDGHVSAMIAADKPQTLDWLRRDATHLNQALQDAGLKTDAGSLSFGLRSEQRTGEQFADRSLGRGNAGAAAADDRDVGTDPASPSAAVWRRAAGGVDVSV